MMLNLTEHDCYRHVLRGAVACDRAVAGVWLRLSPDQHSLLVEVECDLSPAMLAFASALAPGDGSASGNAVTQRHRVVVRDVADDYGGMRREAALSAGIRAVTSMPLIDSEFRAVGVIALYHAKPHHPSLEDAQRLDACCRVASALCEVFGRYAGGALTPAGRQATDAVARLLPACGRESDDESLYRSLSRHLAVVLRELPKGGLHEH